MPELPEVQTVVNTLQPLVGRRLGAVRVLRPDVLHGEVEDPAGFLCRRTVRAITRRAKRIVFDLGSGRQMIVHLGMTGHLQIEPSRAALRTHTHLVVAAGRGSELRFCDPRRFGAVWLLAAGTPRRGRGLGPLGPEPLEVSLAEFRGLLARSRQIKALLLDQRVLAGLGNIYADESLYRAGIHPLARSSDLDDVQVRQLYHSIRRTLRAAIRAGGSSIRDYRDGNGERGWFQQRLQVYGRTGEPCRRCRTLITRMQAAGRSSHLCPNCQAL